MAADTERLLTARLPIENHGNPGLLGVTSRFSGGVIVVTFYGEGAGAETVYLRHNGDSFTQDLLNVNRVDIEAKADDLVTDAYPAPVLILQTTSTSAVLSAAPYASGTSGGNTAFHADFEVVAGGGGSTGIVTPPAGMRAVITSCFLSSSTTGRVGIVDDTDTAGQRIMVAPAIPAGGSIARYLGDSPGYVQTGLAQALNVVYSAGGTFDGSVDGYFQVG